MQLARPELCVTLSKAVWRLPGEKRPMSFRVSADIRRRDTSRQTRTSSDFSVSVVCLAYILTFFPT